MYLGELAALGTAVMWSLTAIFFSYSGGIVGSEVVNRSRLLFAFLFLSISHLLLEGSLFPQQWRGSAGFGLAFPAFWAWFWAIPSSFKLMS